MDINASIDALLVFIILSDCLLTLSDNFKTASFVPLSAFTEILLVTGVSSSPNEASSKSSNPENISSSNPSILSVLSNFPDLKSFSALLYALCAN